MKTFTMLKTEAIRTNKGSVTYTVGQMYTDEDWVAASFAGRGLAIINTTPVLEVSDDVNLDGLNVMNLREMAKEVGVPGYKKMSKELLVSALKARRDLLQPAVEGTTNAK